MSDLGILVSAYIVDLVVGDPKQIPHPVRMIGAAIGTFERWLRGAMSGPQRRLQNAGFAAPPSEGGVQGEVALSTMSLEKAAGVILVMLIAGMTFTLFSLVCKALINAETLPLFSYASVIILVYLASSAIATRELLHSANSVIGALRAGHAEKAREELSMIVGRDTHSLDNRRILRATVETLSENASDGIIAPMFYFAIGGLPLAMTYKAINTLDSMVGYKNEKYLNFGWASARLDDVANFIPARITGSIIVITAFMVSAFHSVVHNGSKQDHADQLHHGGQDTPGCNRISGLDAVRMMLRDGRKHASPNSGIPEAAMAGALGVKLGGTSTYEGVVSEKPFIGDERQDSETFYLYASERALTITKVTSVLGLFAALFILYVRTSLWS
jgi:adenosylcobinamide-phosphate synthase